MSKDPAFLFYPGDYLRDTQCFSEKVQVSYDRIMCEHMRNICISQKQLKFFTKRLNDEESEELMVSLSKVDGGYQIGWVAESIMKRRAYSESRRKNREKHKKTYVKHMENENENENAIKNIKGNEKERKKKFDFEQVWKEYPLKVGKQEALGYFNLIVKTDEDFANCLKAVENYKNSKRVQSGYIMNGSKFFDQWQDWVELPASEKVCNKCRGSGKYRSPTNFEVICDCPSGLGK